MERVANLSGVFAASTNNKGKGMRVMVWGRGGDEQTLAPGPASPYTSLNLLANFLSANTALRIKSGQFA